MSIRITPRNGSLIAVTLLLAIILILFLDSMSKNSFSNQIATSSNFPNIADQNASVMKSSLSIRSINASIGQDRINSTGNMADEEQSTSKNVPMLSSLVTGLEQKVAANPSDVGNQILLAQTYSQMGRNEDGIARLREMRSIHPSNQRIPFILAVLLSRSHSEQDLNEALKLLDNIDGLDATSKSESKKLKKVVVEKLKNRVAL